MPYTSGGHHGFPFTTQSRYADGFPDNYNDYVCQKESRQVLDEHMAAIYALLTTSCTTALGATTNYNLQRSQKTGNCVEHSFNNLFHFALDGHSFRLVRIYLFGLSYVFFATQLIHDARTWDGEKSEHIENFNNHTILIRELVKRVAKVKPNYVTKNEDLWTKGLWDKDTYIPPKLRDDVSADFFGMIESVDVAGSGLFEEVGLGDDLTSTDKKAVVFKEEFGKHTLNQGFGSFFSKGDAILSVKISKYEYHPPLNDWSGTAPGNAFNRPGTEETVVINSIQQHVKQIRIK